MRTTGAGKRLTPGPQPHRARAAVVVLGLALVAPGLLGGCAGRAVAPPPGRPAPPAVPPATAPARVSPGYVARVDSLDAVDATVLAGRRIAIDPGHGGFFRGSLGVDGTTEAEVNLGVALRLRDLLAAHGAQVFLTRESDRDFLTRADSSLRADLTERARLANAFAPDLFVSVHHNADPGGRHDVNETQTYYKLGDEGPSYDLANDVHRALVRNVGIETQRLLPGNFLVVRASDGPALLTEASYLTFPGTEARLRTPAGQQLEAEAIWLGVVRFFMRRAPAIERFVAADPGDPRSQWSLQSGFPVLTARVHGEFDEIRLSVDGTPVTPLRMGDSLWWRPARALAAGPHEATLQVRLAGEGSSRQARIAFRLVKPLDRIVADFPGTPGWRPGMPLALRVRVHDEDGLPVASESLAVRVRARHALPADTLLVLRDGVAWGYFRFDSTRLSRRVPPAPEFRIAREPAVRDELGSNYPEDVSVGIAYSQFVPPLWRTGFARLMPADVPLRNAPGTTGPEPALEWLNRDGFVVLDQDSSGAFVAPRLAGFRTWGADTPWPPRFVPIAGGALHGRRIVLDPEGGGDDAAGSGPSGTRAAAFNLEVARALGGMLVAAGAEVAFTRAGDASVSEVARVQVAEAFRADRVLRIGHAAAPPLAGHYFSSAAGRRWGRRVADACAALGLADSLPVRDAAKYVLTQASATALYASLARIDEPASEARLLAPGALRAEAYALFLALARDFAPADAWEADTLEVRDRDGRPVPGALVTLGGTLVLQAGPDGAVRFVRTEPGPLDAACEDSRVGARTLLLESSRRHVLAGAR